MDDAVASLVKKATEEAWLPAKDLDWDVKVEREVLAMPEHLCLVRDLPAYRSMSPNEQSAYRLRETAAALSNLVFGEERGALLSAQVFIDSQEERPEDGEFLGILITEEARHAAALGRYLKEKIGIVYAPHASMKSIFRALQLNASWELKLIVGQILFEPTACSMLHSLLMRADEPLLVGLIKRVMRDEARHLAYSYTVAGSLVRRFSDAQRKTIEDLLFESTVACLDSFLPVALWEQESLPIGECRKLAVAALEERGLLNFFVRVMPEQLARRGFASPRLRELIESSLIEKVRA